VSTRWERRRRRDRQRRLALQKERGRHDSSGRRVAELCAFVTSRDEKRETRHPKRGWRATKNRRSPLGTSGVKPVVPPHFASAMNQRRPLPEAHVSKMRSGCSISGAFRPALAVRRRLLDRKDFSRWGRCSEVFFAGDSGPAFQLPRFSAPVRQVLVLVIAGTLNYGLTLPPAFSPVNRRQDSIGSTAETAPTLRRQSARPGKTMRSRPARPDPPKRRTPPATP